MANSDNGAAPVDSGSPQSVALDLLQIIRSGMSYPTDAKTVLDLYAECLEATSGHREFR